MEARCAFILLSLIFAAGCTMDQAIECNPPYMRLGIECCLDVNNNSICDSDEGTGANVSAQASGCNPPYFEYKTGECCLDNDSNQICDTDEEENETLQSPRCNLPYFEYKSGECCLDIDANHVCDADEQFPQGIEIEESDEPDPCSEVNCTSGEYCLNGTCVASPVFAAIPSQQVQLFSWCGDGICSASENSSADCCADCGCPSGHYCSNNTCIEGTPPLFIPFYIPQSITYIEPTVGQTVTIRSSSASIGCPSIHGNKIVFSQELSGYMFGVYLYDAYTRNLSKLSSGNNAVNPDIYGAEVVWCDFRASGGSWIGDAYYYDLAGGLEGPIAPRTVSKGAPRIDRNFVVWSEKPNGYDKGGSIHVYHLASNTENVVFNLRKENYTILSPEIWENYAVWETVECQSQGSSCTSRLYLFNLSGWNGNPIVQTEKSLWGYSIGGGKIAYIMGDVEQISTYDFDYDLQVYVYDIDTKVTRQITDVEGPKHHTSIDGETVVWVDKGEDTNNGDVFAYDLSEDKLIRVTNDSDRENCAAVYGNKIVYESFSSDHKHSYLYLYYLS